MRNYILLIALFISTIIIAQDAKEVIRRCNKNLLQIKDYNCKAHIDFDIPGLNIEKIDGTIYYKRPNKFRIKSNGIIFLPKQNPNQILSILADTTSFMPVFIAKETVNGLLCDAVQMVPLKENDIAVAKIFVDTKGYIQKAEITSKENGTATVTNKFDATSKYGMPCQTLISFDVLFKAYHWYHSHANLIWPVSPFKKTRGFGVHHEKRGNSTRQRAHQFVKYKWA